MTPTTTDTTAESPPTVIIKPGSTAAIVNIHMNRHKNSPSPGTDIIRSSAPLKITGG
ncbi:MAG TPA: hypothetical protein VFI97_02255 [Arthrobacter sp.]|nr:hypothetical protein [Arthrobacter sp.]